jgi:hypothetical protein
VEVPRSEVESIDPTGKQALAFEAPERFILYGGAMGGGKTTWLCAYAVDLSMRYSDNIGFLCRHELRSFRRSTMLTLQECLPLELIAQHHKTENFIRFKNGSLLFYGGLGDDTRAIDRLKSMELGWFGIDQAEETSEKFFFMLASRLRHRTAKGLRYKGLLTANPEPNWIKTRFIDQKLPNHTFIPARPSDNPHLPADYEENLKQMNLPPELLRAWLEGDWNAIASIKNIFPHEQVLDAMSRTVHTKESDEEEYGVDVAEYGGDETIIAKKKGWSFSLPGIYSHQDPMESVGDVIRIVNYDKTKPIKVDAIGPGNGVYFRLKELGFNAYPIKGSERPSDEYLERYKNKKTELHFHLAKLLPYIDLPADDVLRSQMQSIRYRTLSNGIIAVESKEELRRRGLPSPDRMEACVYAAAEVEEETDGEVYHTGIARDEKEAQEKKEQRERKRRPYLSAEQEDRVEIEEEIARVTRGQKPGKRLPLFIGEKGDEEDEGKVYYGNE